MKKYFFVFAALILTLSACSSNKDKELYDSASAMYKANNFTGAVTQYQKLIDEYPNGKYTEDSYLALAGIYQMGKISNINKTDAAKMAIEYYQKFYKEFPNSDKAPKALFMIGFMRANDLAQYDSARIAYNEFLSKYPKHDLAESVKAELQNLGKTPDEIIQEKISSSK
jgi:TolA-binding protein